MIHEKTIYRVIRIDYAFDDNMTDEESAERAATQGLCDAGNSIIGDDLDCNDTKIRSISDCGESV